MRHPLFNYRMLFLIGLLVVLVVVLILLKFFGGTSEKPSSPSPPPQPQVESLKFFVPQLKTIPGKTTEDDVKKFPDLKETRETDGGGAQYEFYSPEISRNNIVVTHKGTTVFERVLSIDQDLTHPKLNVFKNKFGEPDDKVTGSIYWGQFFETHIYTNFGFALIANPLTDEVFEVHTFLPMSVAEYRKIWGVDIKEGQSAAEGIGK